jgi:two-component system, OmpR family, sensor histidine kinase KdpD
MIPSYRPATRITNLPAPATYLLALAFSFATTGILLLLGHFGAINRTTIALVFLLPVGLSATFWGLVPGIIAALASFLAFNYYFIEPIHSFRIHNSEDLVILAAFLGVTVVISELVGRVKRNLAAATDREQEALRLYEFNNLLAGSQDERMAAQALLDKIEQALLPLRIEILIENSSEPVLLAKGISLPAHVEVRPFVEPLQTARGLIGEIRLWQKGKSISDSDGRLLKIFAGQGVLAIERLRLAEAARKTKILEESDRLKSSLLSSVSHELRSPLAAVKASVSSLRSGEVEWASDARTDLLATVEEEIDHLNVLVGNLLDMSRIEAGALKPQKKPNMLAEIVSAVSGRMRAQLQNYRFVVEVPEDLPLVNVDFIQIEQVFTNLLANSLKYSPAGSTIKLTARPKDSDNLLVTLTNQSTHVPETDLDRIFDKFYRIDSSDQVTGSGLGLSICKGIIEAHGGVIWAENLPDGLAFNFTLPIN